MKIKFDKEDIEIIRRLCRKEFVLMRSKSEKEIYEIVHRDDLEWRS